MHIEPHDVLAHRRPMLLIDQIVDWGEDWLTSRVTIHADCEFCNKRGHVPSWIALEYMCQTIAALEGTMRLQKNTPIKLGFLMGTKCFEALQPEFKVGQTLTFHAQEQMKSSTYLGVYDCQGFDENDNVIATAVIKAVMPESPDFILRR